MARYFYVMRAPDILARTMSKPRQLKPKDPNPWQYHPRSDHHSKVACWGILFDLLISSESLRDHAANGKIAFGINHRMVDHTNGRKKNLDLVICRPEIGSAPKTRRAQASSFAGLADEFKLELSVDDRNQLAELPPLIRRPVGSVLMALEAKAAMTEFAKARPRLYDELTSSHMVVHGDTDSAIAVGFAMINGSDRFISPTRVPRTVSIHSQPEQLEKTIEKIRSLPRRAKIGDPGFDAIAAVSVRCVNDGITPVTIISDPAEGAVRQLDVLHYNTMINRVVGIYQSRFPNA